MIEGAECGCKKKVVPFRGICPSCGKAMNKVGFEHVGVILTYTILQAPPKGFEAPVKLAMVELREGAHLLCGVKGEREIKIGDEVRVEKEGELYICGNK
jgi:uncharacterized OB-fold protein